MSQPALHWYLGEPVPAVTYDLTGWGNGTTVPEYGMWMFEFGSCFVVGRSRYDIVPTI